MSDLDDILGKKSDNLISDMILSEKDSIGEKSKLVVPPEEGASEDDFAVKIEETLRETEEQAKLIDADSTSSQSWDIARKVVTEFRPVPDFIWRISNYVLSRPEKINEVSEGLLFGLRRLLFAIASDEVLGEGEKVNNVKKAIKIADSDVIAASSVIYAICRRLAGQQFERIWRPILDDALIRARLGFMVGKNDPSFGSGRGMLAGFAGRVGLTILISSGELDQARRALEMLAAGDSLNRVGLTIYNCDPLQVSAFTLSASGCGRDAAMGTVSYGSSKNPEKIVDGPSQLKWVAAFIICENLRMGQMDSISEDIWAAMSIKTDEQKEELATEMKKLVRRGHGWNWFVS